MIRVLPAILALAMAGPVLADEPANDKPLDFDLDNLQGKQVSLSDYRGHWVVVNYWATWCAPCRKEIPDLSNLHDDRDDITVLGLAFEDTEIEVFEAFLEQYPASYPIMPVDTFDPPEAFGPPRALPTTHLVDADGYKVNTWVGPVTSGDITGWIEDQ